ncbi:MAG TPA: GNAT family N-acyltransferase [Gemmatimonadales bacterium]|nr:GNAT family N-acyltransferase [Gemmatimonadales bacterium]
MSGPLVATGFPTHASAVPNSTISAGRYLLRFARTEADLDRLLRLRYEVFNLELNEGLDTAHADQRDEDRFDRRFHHLLIEERESGAVVGTYRMQTGAMAAETGYYSAGLFELATLPASLRAKAVEIGRACVAKAHRNGRVLHLLWRGLAGYLTWNRHSVLFGACSLTSQDEALGLRVHRHLDRLGAGHGELGVQPRPESRCAAQDSLPDDAYPTPKIPALFQAYLTLGARTLGPPAIDREFKTIDWLVLLDTMELPALTYRAFFGHAKGESHR